MGKNWEFDKQWSDQFIPEIKQIVGPLLLKQSSIEVDQKEATDLIILKATDMRIACRIRRPGYIQDYGLEFTIRLSRPSGMETEMNKILSGFGDMYFYGHAGENNKIIQYFVLDLDVFRDAVNNYRDTLKYKEKSNFDDSSRFVGFDIRSFHPSILIAFNIEIKFQMQNHE